MRTAKIASIEVANMEDAPKFVRFHRRFDKDFTTTNTATINYIQRVRAKGIHRQIRVVGFRKTLWQNYI